MGCEGAPMLSWWHWRSLPMQLDWTEGALLKDLWRYDAAVT